MVGKWLGYIQPMCSASGHSWQGLFFFSNVGPFFIKSAFLYVSIIKPPFYNKKARPRYSPYAASMALRHSTGLVII